MGVQLYVALLPAMLMLGAPRPADQTGSLTPTEMSCAGDCDQNGKVEIHELIVAVNIALGSAAVEQCRLIDTSGDGEATVDELIRAVNMALTGCPAAAARLIALSRRGQIASLDLTAPWTVLASADFALTMTSARCRNGRCLVVHPSPADKISVVAASDLSASEPIVLEPGADPRDVALIGDQTAVVSQYGRPELLEVNLKSRASVPIDLSELADDDGLPEPQKLASCGRRVFAQLRRVDHETGAPTSIGAALAVIDLDRAAGDRVIDVDPLIPGAQAIALAGQPNFDMTVDCAAGVLYVAEPAPLMQGGGGYEQVDLETFTAREFPIDTGAEVGGFEVLGPSQYWIITHTEFGPGASSHLNLVGGAVPDTHNTFANEHVNDLAFDRQSDLLFFPDPCSRSPSNPSCDTGIHVFHAHTGARASIEAVDLGFPPIEVVVSR